MSVCVWEQAFSHSDMLDACDHINRHPLSTYMPCDTTMIRGAPVFSIIPVPRSLKTLPSGMPLSLPKTDQAPILVLSPYTYLHLLHLSISIHRYIYIYIYTYIEREIYIYIYIARGLTFARNRQNSMRDCNFCVAPELFVLRTDNM